MIVQSSDGYVSVTLVWTRIHHVIHVTQKDRIVFRYKEETHICIVLVEQLRLAQAFQSGVEAIVSDFGLWVGAVRIAILLPPRFGIPLPLPTFLKWNCHTLLHQDSSSTEISTPLSPHLEIITKRSSAKKTLCTTAMSVSSNGGMPSIGRMCISTTHSSQSLSLCNWLHLPTQIQKCALSMALCNLSQLPYRRRSKVVNRPAISKDWLRYYECCQDDNVNCSRFLKDKMKLTTCSVHVRTRIKMNIVQLNFICLWTN